MLYQSQLKLQSLFRKRLVDVSSLVSVSHTPPGPILKPSHSVADCHIHVDRAFDNCLMITSLRNCQCKVMEFLCSSSAVFLSKQKNGKIPEQSALLVPCFRPSLPPEKEARASLLRLLHPSPVTFFKLSKLSVPCGDQNISRCRRRKKILQLQADVISVVEEEEPLSRPLVCKATQNPIHRLLSLSVLGSDTLEVHSKCLLIGSINVEDVRKAGNSKIVNYYTS